MSKILIDTAVQVDELAESLQEHMGPEHQMLKLKHPITFMQRGTNTPREGHIHLNVRHDQYATYVTVGAKGTSLPFTDLERISVLDTAPLQRWLQADTHVSAITLR